ncbi:hypothetical protein GLAREA_08414 [Glarea lozoyensis ATCC 20868]|uniref:SprT-like domain-containing protein n=1 Tax=Glarea lozoyensis (strain ATCC 20868 / MF5171) TaxID=1116229 RepID=S3CDF5_GLAL2|nr:uncharacterized protein GLAREA_08414 [Glarea lozoyensis ATCC 20868]EPE24562.1 hypothetical protein GLAREA_08414 [Glarea lozoyensis ATCC 20868]
MHYQRRPVIPQPSSFSSHSAFSSQLYSPSPYHPSAHLVNSNGPTTNSMPKEQVGGITMERTRSGNSIYSDTPIENQYFNESLDTDERAASRVAEHFKARKHRRGKHEDILRKIIKLEDPKDVGEIDDKSLSSIVTTCDTIFFGGALAGRVQWEWSSQERYHSELIGTTALRKCSDREGYETLIILSEPILTSSLYDRRLLLSAFIHELIHCYLFIRCGFKARNEGGHTRGWHDIAYIINKCINKWVGGDYLSLCNMKANLTHFHNSRYRPAAAPRTHAYRHDLDHNHDGCSHSPAPPELYGEVTMPFLGTFETSVSDRSYYGWPAPYGESQFF